MEKKKYYISTAIAYTSGKPHIGNTYEIVLADAIARYKRLVGYDVYFQTGTDEHGQKMEQSAEKQGIKPIELADKNNARFRELWKILNISNDDFIRTTQDRHKKAVWEMIRKMQEKGDIYLGEYEGWYCTPCEAYWTETQLMEGNLCPDCGRETAKLKESSYFFKRSKYQDAILEHINKNLDFIRPESRRNEIISFIKEGLRDLSISRINFSWGIPMEENPKHVIYVWVDALTNYLSALGYFDKPEQGESYGKCRLVLMNFGNSIYDSLKEADTTEYTKNQLEKHTKKNYNFICVKRDTTILNVPSYACGICISFALLKFNSFPTSFS